MAVEHTREQIDPHYNYFRDYDPSTGRYLESDPIGLLGGTNSYGYAGQDPINSADPTGLLDLKRLIECMIGSERINKQGCLNELSGQVKQDYERVAITLTKEAAETVEQCATCVTVCTFKGFVGSSPDEWLATWGNYYAGRKATAMLTFADEAAGAAARSLLNRATAVAGFISTIECSIECF